MTSGVRLDQASTAELMRLRELEKSTSVLAAVRIESIGSGSSAKKPLPGSLTLGLISTPVTWFMSKELVASHLPDFNHAGAIDANHCEVLSENAVSRIHGHESGCYLLFSPQLRDLA